MAVCMCRPCHGRPEVSGKTAFLPGAVKMKSGHAAVRIEDGFPRQRMVVLPRPVVDRAVSIGLPMRLVASDIGYFPDAAGHYVHRPHGAPQCIVILCVRGKGWAHIGRIRHDVHPGDVAIILPGQAHSYGCDSRHPWTIHWCHAAGPAAGYFTDMLARRDALPVLHADSYLNLIPLFEQILEELTLGYSADHLAVASMALGHLLARIAAGGQSTCAGNFSRNRIRHAVEYMKNRWQTALSVPDLARACNLSTSHFGVLFRKSTGYAPLDYFLRMKMQRAAEMLDTTDRPVKEIAADVGMADALYFSRTFHRIYKMSPSEYRRITKG